MLTARLDRRGRSSCPACGLPSSALLAARIAMAQECMNERTNAGGCCCLRRILGCHDRKLSSISAIDGLRGCGRMRTRAKGVRVVGWGLLQFSELQRTRGRVLRFPLSRDCCCKGVTLSAEPRDRGLIRIVISGKTAYVLSLHSPPSPLTVLLSPALAPPYPRPREPHHHHTASHGRRSPKSTASATTTLVVRFWH